MKIIFLDVACAVGHVCVIFALQAFDSCEIKMNLTDRNPAKASVVNCDTDAVYLLLLNKNSWIVGLIAI